MQLWKAGWLVLLEALAVPRGVVSVVDLVPLISLLFLTPPDLGAPGEQ